MTNLLWLIPALPLRAAHWRPTGTEWRDGARMRACVAAGV